MKETNPNIAVVVLDTLRKDAFDDHFQWMEGVSYENAWSTSHWTVPAHASLFTGKYGSELAVHGKSKHLNCPEPTLAELLKEDGWTTRGYSSNVHVSHWFGFDRGFDNLHHNDLGDDLGFNWAEFIFDNRDTGPERYVNLLQEIHKSDAPLLSTLKQGVQIKLKDLGIRTAATSDSGAQETYDWVRNMEFNDSNEFLFLNLMEAHVPYEAPVGYQTVEPVTFSGPQATIGDGPEEDVEYLKTAYADCVRYLSDIYEDIYEELASQFDVIITLSDHGEAFGEYGGWGHFSGLWPTVTRVPLLISTPGNVNEPEPTDAPVSILDVFQTICSYSNIETGSETRGVSLTDGGVKRDHLLVETHGMLSKARKRLLNDEYSEDTLNQYDNILHAVAGETGYTFERFNDKIGNYEGGVDDAEEVISTLVDGLDSRDSNVNDDVPAHVEKRLEELGYA